MGQFAAKEVIRPATDADFPAILAIFREVLAEGDSYDFPSDATDEQVRGLWFGSGKLYVAEVKGRILGAALIRANTAGPTVANAAYIVARESRGLGLGRRLGEFSLLEAARLGYTDMQFNFVVATNEPAVKLWTSLGFVEVGRKAGAFQHPTLGPVDALIMRRRL